MACKTPCGAHPRSRGADDVLAYEARADSGSSPLARGGPGQHLPHRDRDGLIPARAGRTAYRPTVSRRGWAHPRSRGADAAGRRRVLGHGGSSPLARGGPARRRSARRVLGLIPARAGRTVRGHNVTHKTWAHPRSRGADGLDDRERHAGHGLIPARAGRTSVSRGIRALRWAHPRSRGADRRLRSAGALSAGSSPLARGGLRHPRRSLPLLGLIPARAGRTSGDPAPRPVRGAHPRSRGADLGESWDQSAEVGSSPLARGGPSTSVGGGAFGGLIPARAGRTTVSTPARRGPRAHPRSRGADARASMAARRSGGSSPLARGGRPSALRQGVRPGLIPARAGRTSCRIGSRRARGAHPRSRGADSVRDGRLDVGLGSSPLARGGPTPPLACTIGMRLIPARAGRT